MTAAILPQHGPAAPRSKRIRPTRAATRELRARLPQIVAATNSANHAQATGPLCPDCQFPLSWHDDGFCVGEWNCEVTK